MAEAAVVLAVVVLRSVVADEWSVLRATLSAMAAVVTGVVISLGMLWTFRRNRWYTRITPSNDVMASSTRRSG